MAAVWFLHLQQTQAWRKSVVFEFAAETQSSGPFLLSTSPLKFFFFFFFFLIAEKREQDCALKKKKKKKKNEGVFNLGNECFAMQPGSRESAKQGRAVY